MCIYECYSMTDPDTRTTGTLQMRSLVFDPQLCYNKDISKLRAKMEFFTILQSPGMTSSLIDLPCIMVHDLVSGPSLPRKRPSPVSTSESIFCGR